MPTARRDRLLPWIAAERALRAVLLVAVGIVLLTHLHENWARDVTDVTRSAGLNPKSNWIQRILHDAAKLSAGRTLVFGIIALAYAGLEGTEAYGLWKGRRWAEWLTVLATSLLLIPEIWALTKGASVLKVGGLIVNIAIVAYLLVRLRARGSPSPSRIGREHRRRREPAAIAGADAAPERVRPACRQPVRGTGRLPQLWLRGGPLHNPVLDIGRAHF